MTPEQIRKLTDPQINEMVYKTTVKVTPPWTKVHPDGSCFVTCNRFGVMLAADYCNDPSAIMPLVFSAGISLVNTDGSGEYTACGVGTLVDGYCGDSRNDVYVDADTELALVWRDKKACRAAAIVYLMSKGVI